MTIWQILRKNSKKSQMLISMKLRRRRLQKRKILWTSDFSVRISSFSGGYSNLPALLKETEYELIKRQREIFGRSILQKYFPEPHKIAGVSSGFAAVSYTHLTLPTKRIV